MAIAIDMPKLSDTMDEGVIAKWNVKEGDKVSSGDVIAEVETDKATMDVEVFDDGTVLKIIAHEGDAIPLGGLMAVIGEEGEDPSEIMAKYDGQGQKASSDSKKEESPKDFDPILDSVDHSSKEDDEKSSGQEDDRIKASPLARKMAEDTGLDLSEIKGSGPDGRIIKRDIEQVESGKKEQKTPSQATPSAVKSIATIAEDKEIRISQMRKTIAKRLAESKFTNPHFYETVEINMKNSMEARRHLNEISDVKISFNDLVIKACAVALRKHPWVNSSWQGDKIIQHAGVHVAMAVAVDEGLVTPVIRNADQKGLRQLATESKSLAAKARDKELQPEDWEGSTFSVSNLGMFGIDQFTAIINPPNACILAIGAIRDIPVVENGEIVPGKVMKVTLSSDHRVVDGVIAAEFLTTVREVLESPLGMLL